MEGLSACLRIKALPCSETKGCKGVKPLVSQDPWPMNSEEHNLSGRHRAFAF